MTWEIPTMKELAAVFAVAFIAYWAWVWWSSRTFSIRSTRAMLDAWPLKEPGATIVFYRCSHNWGAHRATFFVLAKNAAGYWFEAELKVLALTAIIPGIRQELTPAEARQWLAAIPQAASELQKYFGTTEITA